MAEEKTQNFLMNQVQQSELINGMTAEKAMDTAEKLGAKTEIQRHNMLSKKNWQSTANTCADIVANGLDKVIGDFKAKEE